jgi:hypothetical protein
MLKEEEKKKEEKLEIKKKLKKEKRKKSKSHKKITIDNFINNNEPFSKIHKKSKYVDTPKTTKLKSEEKAIRMLEKMGWKGHGLGKFEQGIKTPLIAKKTGDKYGVIINSNFPAAQKKIDFTNFYNREPTKIIMITNMVLPEEMDEDLLFEIKEECERFGIVNVKKIFRTCRRLSFMSSKI